ncbi:uncharacterized protein LOC119071124 [Bradysia coprophila]|uniref:uncharacterized protein LOC119071124 n=1 Tax=Bradysia coprophila TaxID=38358 RepID=UPI00187DC7C5|nr:uncharacterized protein LOC119071124 [Bradysia coprophila]XP_037031670.1 uncharacterized protein LOC119071124 [Bradysia coprophila]
MGSQISVGTSGDDSLSTLRNNLLHTRDSNYVHQKLSQLLNNGKINSTTLAAESELNIVKCIARVHGLPTIFKNILVTLPNQEKPPTPSYKYKVLLIIKYAVLHNHDFITLQNLFSLLQSFPADLHRVADFFTEESVTQLMLSIITILSPDRIASDGIDPNVVWQLENYLPLITGNYKGDVKRCLEKMGYWSGNAVQHIMRMKEDGDANFLRTGNDIITTIHKKKGINVSAHVVKTQQTEALTTEENVSEKTEMLNISLSNSFNQGRTRTMAAAKAKETLATAKSATGSDRCWYKTTGIELNNFLLKARGGGAISPVDIEYLTNKLTGYKFSITQSNRDMIVKIAETFYLISKYQQLKLETVLTLLKKLLHEDHNGGRYTDARIHVLQTTDRYCNRFGKVPDVISEHLIKFRDDSKGCTKRMERAIWDILSTDDKNIKDNIKHAISKLRSVEDCESALNYLQRQISIKGREEELEAFPEIVEKLLNVAQGKYSDTKDSGEEEEDADDYYRLGWSELNWLDTINYPGTVVGTIIIANTKKYLFPKKQEKNEDCDKPDPAALSSKALEVLEDHLQRTRTSGVEPADIEILICIGIAANASEDMKGKTVRCILRSFEKGLRDPELKYFEKFSNDQLGMYYNFLLKFTTSGGIDKRLQVLTLILLGNLLNVTSDGHMEKAAAKHLAFFRRQLQRNDILLSEKGKVVLEDELEKDFFHYDPPPEEYEMVSTYIVKILLKLVHHDSTTCDEVTMATVSQVMLNSPGKMTKILCSEFIFAAAKACAKFSTALLNTIQGICFSPIADVHINITSAYCTALSNFPSSSLEAEQVNFLVNLYSFKKVYLDKVDFSEWINPKILQTFHNASKAKLKVSEQVFHLLALILNNTCADGEDSQDYPVAKVTLDTVTNYCVEDPLHLPSTIVEAIENLLLESDVFDEICAGIVEQCMLAGRWVSDSIIEEFSKYLWYEPETSVPFLRRIAIANENQEVSNPIFENFQMELVGLRLHPDVTTEGAHLLRQIGMTNGHPSELFQCFSNHIYNGKLLSPLNLEVVLHLLETTWKRRGKERQELIQNLSWVVANGQSLPKSIIDSALNLEGGSGDDDYETQLDFAIAVTQKNQHLPEQFLFRIYKDLWTNQKVLTLIKTMIQCNYPLPVEVIKNYCQKLLQLSEKAAAKNCIASNLVVSLLHLLENNLTEDQSTLELIMKILQNAVRSQNITLVGVGKKGLKLLPKSMIGADVEEEFGLKGISVGAAALIARFLARRKRPVTRQLLQNIEDLQRRGSFPSVQLPSKKMDEIERHLGSDLEFIEKVGKLLIGGRNGVLNDFEIRMMESICFTMANARSLELVKVCRAVIASVVKSRNWQLSRSCLNQLSVNKDNMEWLVSINVQDEAIDALIRWVAKPSSSKRRATLGRIFQNFELCCKHYSKIIEALRATNQKEWKKVPNLGNAVAACVTESQGNVCDQQIVRILKEQILNGDIVPIVLQAYHVIQNLTTDTDCLVALSTYFKKFQKKLTKLDINWFFRIFIKAANHLEFLPTVLFDFLFDGIINANPVIRGKSFEILLVLRQKNTNQWQKLKEEGRWDQMFQNSLLTFYSEVYGPYDNEEMWNLEEDEFNINLLYILHASSFWELGGLRKLERSKWIHHLLVSDTVLSLAVTIDEQFKLLPLADEVCNLLSPGERLDFVETLKDYLPQSPVSTNQLLAFTVSAFASTENKTEEFTKNNVGTTVWWESLIYDELSKILCAKVNGLSHAVAKMGLSEAGVPVDLLQLLVTKLEKGTGFREFQKLLEFVRNNSNKKLLMKSHLEEIDEQLELDQMEISLQTVVLMSHLPKSSSLTSVIHRVTHKLLSKRYDYIGLQKIFKQIEIEKKKNLPGTSGLEVLENVLYQMNAYQVTSDRAAQLFTTLEQKKVPDWIATSNSFVMEHLYSGSQGVKTSTTLVKEFSTANPQFTGNLAEFSASVKQIQDGCYKKPEISTEFICNWTVSEISNWARTMQGKLSIDNLTEFLTVVSRACVILRNYRLTPVQILSVYSSMSSGGGLGKLLQVATGSGKSTIIATIAVFKALQNLTVDIYTSSSVLAERDAKTWASFYKLFCFTCDHNGDKGSGYIRGEKNCYKKTIVYGDTSQFQFDALRHDYSGLGTRASRLYKNSFAIVDEVDSMLVDDSSKLARLSSNLPGMDLLQIMYHLIWQRLYDVQNRLFAVQDKTYYLEGARSRDKTTGNMLYTYLHHDGTHKRVKNVAMHILNSSEEELEASFIYEVKNIDNFVTDHLKMYTRALIGDEPFKDNGKLIQKLALPKPLVEFSRSQVNNWIDSAITAVAFQENVHYVVDQDRIKPVDFHSTGIIQSSTNWNNGLHQFLQIKHSLKVTTETVTTNFLSNMAMFQKYGKDLIGFTGTLGSSFGQSMLKEVYNVETIIIPEMNYKLFQQLPDIVVPNEKEWLETVAHSALHEISKLRAVLVICQTIKQAELVEAELAKRSHGKVVVKMYIRNDQNQEKQVEQVNPGDVIVATNLAGRGTDIKTFKVEKFGGLHVILTFLPDSLRVEEQAFGRTARQGNNGTGELILVSGDDSAEVMKRRRDMHERYALTTFKDSELALIQTKDKLFSRFCKLYSKIRAALNGWLMEKLGWDSLTVLEQTVLQAIEEQWAIFLKKIDDDNIAVSDAEEKYKHFETGIEADFQNRKSIAITQSCFYWIQCGNEYYKRKKMDKALQCYDKAISTDADFAAGAHAGKGFVYLNTKKPKDGYKLKAISHLTEALTVLYTEIGMYTTAQTLLQHRGGQVDSELFKQLTEKVNLIGDFCRIVEGNISASARSLRRVYVTETLPDTIQSTRQVDDLKPVVPCSKHESFGNFSLQFYDLTYFWDTGLQCQALDTIDACGKYCKNMSISVDSQNLEELFNQVKDHTKTLPILQIDGANWTEVRKLVSALTPKSFSLVIAGNKDFATKLSNITEMSSKTFAVSYERNDVMCRKTLKKGFEPTEIPDDVPLRVEIELENTREMANMKSLNLDAEISLIFRNVSKETIDKNWQPALQGFTSNTVTFSGLETSKIKSIVVALRTHNKNFRITLEGMSHNQANQCLSAAVRRQEEMDQTEMKEMGQQFSSDYIPLEMIRELSQRGILLMPVFGEKAFVPWRSVISVALIATVQVVAGGVLVCTGFGATLGMGLITEGFADYVTSYRAFSSREFNWTSYAIQKAVSLTITCVSMGLGALKDGAKGIAQLGQSAATEVAEQAGTKMVTGVAKQTLNATISATAKTLKSLVVKHIAVQATETVARTGINAVVETLAEFAFDSVKDKITLEVDATVRREFRKPEFTTCLATYSALDMARRSKLLEYKVNGWLMEVTNPHSNDWNKLWDQVGYPLIQGILSDPKYLGSGFSMTTRLIGLINGSEEILTVTTRVTENIEVKLRSEVKSFTPAYALQERFGINSADAEKVVKMMDFGNEGIFYVKDFPNESDLETCKIESLELEDMKKLFDTLHSTEKKFTMDQNADMSRLMKTVADHLTSHIIHVANRQLVSPITTLAVGKLVAAISQEIQSKYLVSDRELSEDQLKVKELKEKDPKDLSSDDKKFLLENDRPVTFAEQIRGNAKDYTVAYQKRDIIANILTMTKEQIQNQKVPDKFTKEADKAIDQILSGGPADMTTVFMLAQLNGANVKMVDDPSYVPTEEDKKAGVQIIVWEKPKEGETVGHYTLKDTKTGESRDFEDSSGKNNCAYDVLSHITGKSADELRLQGAVFVACNQEKFAEIDKSAQWIRERYPQEAANLLHAGGFKKNSDRTPESKIALENTRTKDKKNIEIIGDDTGNKVVTYYEYVDPYKGNEMYSIKNNDDMNESVKKCLDSWDNNKGLSPVAQSGTLASYGFDGPQDRKTGVRIDQQERYSHPITGEDYVNIQIQVNGISRKENGGRSTTIAEAHVPAKLLETMPNKVIGALTNSMRTGKACHIGQSHYR